MIYKLGAGKMERIDVSANNAKNNLPIGTVLKMNGYNNPSYVIVKNLGIDEKYGYGARYQSVSLVDGTFRQHTAFDLEHINEKRDNRIQVYITDEIKTQEECLALWEKATMLADVEKNKKDADAVKRQELILKGREIALKTGVESAKALIVAEHEVDESDSMTDYFATKMTQLVVLGTSKHTRDLFGEMRTLAGRFDKTAHLAIPPNVDSSGSALTEVNKGWWRPADEHREKYSMGAGYYLKTGSSYSSGWLVRKMKKWGDEWDDSVYISLAQISLLKEAA